MRVSLTASAASSEDFTDHLTVLARGVECRPAHALEERQAIFQLRYQAYLRDGTISPNPLRTFTDAADDAENAHLLGFYIGGKLASSVRLHIGSPKHPYFPSLEVFPDVLWPLVNSGKVVVDLTCFAADETLSRVNRMLPYFTLRPWILAAEYFHADDLLAATLVQHQPFFRRAFNSRLLSEHPRRYPQLAKPHSLVALHFASTAKQLYLKYPFLRATMVERQELFNRCDPPSPSQKKELNLPA